MRSGRMRIPLVYQVRTLVDDGAGSSAEEWEDSFPLWARVVPSRAEEAEGPGPRVVARRVFEVTCRFDPRIVETGRFRIEGSGRLLHISSVLDRDLRGLELTVAAHDSDP